MALTRSQVSIVDVNDGQQGESGHSYILDIVGGPRSITYDEFGNPPSVNFNFSAELYVDGVLVTPSSYSWSTEGALSGSGTGSTFVPTLNAVADVSALPGTSVKLSVVFNGVTIKRSEPLAIAQIGSTGERGLQGIQGEDGAQGIQGPKGSDGLSSYTHIAYANSANGVTDFSTTDSNRAYVGMYVDNTPGDSLNPADYNWSLIKGADGTQGIQGPAGADGLTPYLHIAYATNSTGTEGFSTTVSIGKTYIGTYTDHIAADSSNPALYNWTLIKGDKGDIGDTGVGVSSVTEYYLATTASSGVLVSNPNWTTSVQPLTVTNKYLWNYEKINYTNGSSQETAPIIIGVYGDTGRSIDTIQEYYLVSSANSGITTGNADWSTTIPTMTAELKYLWNYEKITYKNPVSVENTTPVIIGVYGDKGDQGAPGTPARIINLISTSQILKSPPGGGATTPATTTVSAVVLNTGTLSWTYSVNGAAFSSTKPAYVSTPSGNSVTITGSTMTANTIAVKVSDGVVSDTYTVAKVQDGTDGDDGIPGSVGPKGEDAYTVILSNEAHAFAGDVSNALAGSTYFDIIAYKGATRILSTVGTITGTKTGISASITNNGSTTARVTVTVTTGLTSGGILTIPITVDGKVFTKQFVYTISFKGQPGQPGQPGQQGPTGPGGLSSILLNENQPITVTTGRLVSPAQTVTIPFTAFSGSSRVACTATVGSLPTGVSVTSNTAGTTSANGSIVLAFALNANLGGVTTAFDTGSITITVTANSVAIPLVFSYAKVVPGTNGTARMYFVEPAVDSVVRLSNGTYSSATISVLSYYRDNTSTTRTARTAYWKAEYLVGATWTSFATHTASLISTYAPSIESVPATATALRFTAYSNVGLTTIYDLQTVAIVSDGRAITGVDVWYYLSTSSTSLTGGVWDTTAPAWVDGRFMWSKTVTTYSTGDPTESTPVCITGATGRGISSIIEEFYLSTSKTTQTGSSWKTTPDPWSPGKYMWTRSKITYTSGTPATDTTTPLVSSEWEAVNEIEVGGRNLLPRSGNFTDAGDWGPYTGVTSIVVADGKLILQTDSTSTPRLKNSTLFPLSTIREQYTVSVEYISATPISLTGKSSSSLTSVNELGAQNIGTIERVKDIDLGDDRKRSIFSWLSLARTDTLKSSWIMLSLPLNATVEIINVKIEKGNKATNWTPAPEDTNEFINEVANGISDLDTQLRQYTNDNIAQLQTDVEEALGTKELAWHYASSAPTIPMPGMVWVDTSKTLYVPKRYNATAEVWEPLVPQTAADVGAYPDNLGQALASSFADFEANFNEGVYIQSIIDSQLFVDALAEKADASYATEFSQSIGEFNLAISSLQTDSTEHGETVQNIKDNFKFSPDGLNISKSSSPFNVNITNSQLSFRNGEEDLAWLDGNTMYISQIKVESKNPDIKPQLIVGVHSITKHDADTTIVRWVG